jgi:hypothetical protein
MVVAPIDDRDPHGRPVPDPAPFPVRRNRLLPRRHSDRHCRSGSTASALSSCSDRR